MNRLRRQLVYDTQALTGPNGHFVNGKERPSTPCMYGVTIGSIVAQLWAWRGTNSPTEFNKVIQVVEEPMVFRYH